MTDGPTDLKRCIRDIPDFPKPGIVFKDITAAARRRDGVPRHRSTRSSTPYRGARRRRCSASSRAASSSARRRRYALGTGIAIVRKPGKLPYRTHRASYELEYGTDTLEIHHDAIGSGPPRAPDRRPARDRRHGVGGDRARRALRRQVVTACAFVIELALPRRGRRAARSARGARLIALRSAVRRVTRSRPRRREPARSGTGLAVTAALCVAELVGGWLTQQPRAAERRGAHVHRRRRARRSRWFALWIGSRPASAQKTFGYYRAEILAAFVNGVVLLRARRVIVLIEAWRRLHDPPAVARRRHARDRGGRARGERLRRDGACTRTSTRA